MVGGVRKGGTGLVPLAEPAGSGAGQRVAVSPLHGGRLPRAGEEASPSPRQGGKAPPSPPPPPSFPPPASAPRRRPPLSTPRPRPPAAPRAGRAPALVFFLFLGFFCFLCSAGATAAPPPVGPTAVPPAASTREDPGARRGAVAAAGRVIAPNARDRGWQRGGGAAAADGRAGRLGFSSFCVASVAPRWAAWPGWMRGGYF